MRMRSTLIVLSWLLVTPAATAQLPIDFEDELLLGGLDQPVSLAFLPDGRMLIVQRAGEIRIADPSADPIVATLYLSLPDVESTGERGLFDIVLDPDFAANGWLYLYYTHAPSQRHRISRFTHTGATADPASELVVWQDAQTWKGIGHIGGGLDIGPDGHLYLSTGDENDGGQAQDLTQSGGKVIRVATDGSTPADNPFVGFPVGAVDETIWALGLRNPLRLHWDLADARLFVGDVGQDTFEEIHLATPGANLGWPTCDGPCATGPFTDPLFAYAHTAVGGAVIGGFVYRSAGGATSPFPSTYDGVYFFGDFAQGWIRYLVFDAGGALIDDVDFHEAAGNLVFLEQGPDGSLYYIRFSLVTFQSEIRRVRYLPGAPLIQNASATPTSGPGPSLQVSFSAAASDPQGDPVGYRWIFGDGSESTSPGTQHTYASPGIYEARLEVSDGTLTRSSAPIQITVGQPPVLSIVSPADGSSFRSNQQVALIATYSDPDGPLAAADLRWDISLLHNEHRHPENSVVGSASTSITTPIDDHDFHEQTALEITLSATDADGLTTRVTHVILPEKVDLVFASAPPGLDLVRDGQRRTAPYDYRTLIDLGLDLDVPSPQCLGGTEYVFDSWSDGGAQAHTLFVPDTPQTFTASFTDNGPCERVTDAQIALYAFDEGSGTSVGDSSGVAPALDLTIADPGAVTWLAEGGLSLDALTSVASPGNADKLIDAFQASGALTVEAWITPASLMLFGPARIVALAQGSTVGADLVLGQGPSPAASASYTARLRTTTTTAFGVPSLDTPIGSLSTSRTQVVFTRDAAGTTTLYLDGAAIVNGTATGDFSTWADVPLILGNEPTGDRGWLGELHLVAFHDRALSAAEVARNLRAVTPDNRAPLAVADAYTVSGDETLTVTTSTGVLVNDSDPDGDLLSAQLVSLPTEGTLAWSTDGSFAYTHDGGPVLSDSFSYRADDGLIGTLTTVTIDVIPDAPVIQRDPVDRIVAPGESAVFRCPASSTLALSWAWERDGAIIPGADAEVYVTPPTNLSDAGARFRCVVSNAAASVSSSEATLDVVESARARSGLLALYEFLDGEGGVADDTSGFEPLMPLPIADPNATTWLPEGGLHVHAPTALLSPSAASKIFAHVIAAGEITVEAWVTPDNLQQFGPARFVSMSQSATLPGGNFVLGQGSSPTSTADIEMRLRTTTTSVFGTPSLKSGPDALGLGTHHVVYTRAADGTARLYQDGVEIAAMTVSGDMSNWGFYGLTLANDRTLDRAWLGTLHLIAIYDRALDPNEVAKNFGVGEPTLEPATPAIPVPLGPAVAAFVLLAGLALLWMRSHGSTRRGRALP